MKKTISLLLLLAGSSLFGNPLSAEDMKPGSYTREFQSTYDGTTQPYDLFLPTELEEEKPLPLVVVLHGKGARYDAWFEHVEIREIAEQYGWVVVAPDGRGDWFYLGPGEQDVLDSIEDVKSIVPINENRLYVIGHSMGGWGSWHFSSTHADMVAACVALAGWSPHELLGNLEHTPPLAIHGDSDDAVTVDYTRKTVARLGELGVSHRYIEAEGYGHGSDMINDYLPTIAQWIEEHKRPDAPTSINYSAFTPERGRYWWIAIDRIDTFPKVANIEASIEEGILAVKTNNLSAFHIIEEALPSNHRPTAISIDDGGVLSLDKNYYFVKEDGHWVSHNAKPEFHQKTFSSDLPEDLPLRLMEIVVEQTKADAALICSDFVALHPRNNELSKDDILDLFLRHHDDLYTVEVARDQLYNLMRQREWAPAWWGEIKTAISKNAEDKETLIVYMPEVVAEVFPHPTKPTDKVLRGIILDYLNTHNSLLKKEGDH